MTDSARHWAREASGALMPNSTYGETVVKRKRNRRTRDDSLRIRAYLWERSLMPARRRRPTVPEISEERFCWYVRKTLDLYGVTTRIGIRFRASTGTKAHFRPPRRTTREIGLISVPANMRDKWRAVHEAAHAVCWAKYGNRHHRHGDMLMTILADSFHEILDVDRAKMAQSFVAARINPLPRRKAPRTGGSDPGTFVRPGWSIPRGVRVLQA